MIALLLALATAPVPWRDEILCWDSGYCQKRVVNLGDWDPRPAEWPQNAPLNAPRAWSADETGPSPATGTIYMRGY